MCRHSRSRKIASFICLLSSPVINVCSRHGHFILAPLFSEEAHTLILRSFHVLLFYVILRTSVVCLRQESSPFTACSCGLSSQVFASYCDLWTVLAFFYQKTSSQKLVYGSLRSFSCSIFSHVFLVQSGDLLANMQRPDTLGSCNLTVCHKHCGLHCVNPGLVADALFWVFKVRALLFGRNLASLAEIWRILAELHSGK